MSTTIISLEQMSDLHRPERDRLFERLLEKLNACKHVFLVANQGWGIKEYVNELGYQLAEKNPDIHTCYLDMRSAYTANSFLELFASAFIQKFPEETSGIEVDKSSMDVLRLPELIARRKKKNLVIFLANVHLFSRFRDPIPFLRKIRLYLRVQKNCTYCFYGRNIPVIKDFFHHPGSLSGLGKLYVLNHDPTNHRSAFVRKLFHDHQKGIGYFTAVNMSYMVDNHPFYLKLLAWHSLMLTKDTCTPGIVEKSLHNLVLHFDYSYNRIAESLTQKQLCYLKALMEGNKELYSRTTREAYLLGSTSNVAKIASSFEKKEIIRIGRYETVFTDPLFREWLRRRYFGK